MNFFDNVNEILGFRSKRLPQKPATKAPPPVAKAPDRPYPEKLLIRLEMTEEEYNALPLWSSLAEDALQTCELGFRFRMQDGIVCEVVRGLDMDLNQWGGGLSVPERGPRYYRAYCRKLALCPLGVA
jgi:hypothetical protein